MVAKEAAEKETRGEKCLLENSKQTPERAKATNVCASSYRAAVYFNARYVNLSNAEMM
jgi:hypothetical protein